MKEKMIKRKIYSTNKRGKKKKNYRRKSYSNNGREEEGKVGKKQGRNFSKSQQRVGE
jgi:hypothetical protein